LKVEFFHLKSIFLKITGNRILMRRLAHQGVFWVCFP